MKNECNIIRDLLPLCAENIASDDSIEFVEKHLATCEACREEYERIKENEPIGAGGLQEDVSAMPLMKLRRKMRIKKIQTVAVTAFLVIALFFSTFAFLTAPIYFPYSEDIITVTEYEDEMINFTFDKKVTHYASDLYHDSYVEDSSRYEISAWTTLWDKWFSKKEHLPLSFDEGYQLPVYYVSNNGDEAVCIYGEPMADAGIISLPRLTLGFYLMISVALFGILLLTRFILRKKEAAKIWTERIMLYPLSFAIAYLIVVGFSFVTYSITRDFLLIVFISIPLWCGLLFAHGVLRIRKEIKDTSKELEQNTQP